MVDLAGSLIMPRVETTSGRLSVPADVVDMIEAAARLGVEIVPTFASGTEPSGMISRAAFETLRDELVAALADLTARLLEHHVVAEPDQRLLPGARVQVD